jgi:hypothetical protein
MLQRGTIEAADVSRLRNAFLNEGLTTADDAEALFALNETCPQQDAAWADFYIDALTDYLVHEVRPEGYLTAEQANPLVARIAPEGVVAQQSNIDLLVNVIDQARWSPVSLTQLALQQVRRAVVTGEGALRDGQARQCGAIRVAEVELVRRILYAFGGDGHVAITRPEAEALFDINAAIVDPQANAAWTDLFVKAVTNAVMAASGQAVPTREEGLRRDTWLMEAKGDMTPLALLSAMVASSVDAVRATYQDQSAEERALVRLEQQRIEIITNEPIAQAEATWLCERIGRNGRLTPNEAALVSCLSKDSPKIHPDLQAAVERLAHAA